MERAFILLNVETGTEDDVLKELKKIQFVEEAFVAYGGYDLIAKVKANDMKDLKDSVSHKIRSLDKVRTTFTLIVVQE